jgi:hypothetical protein
VTRHLISIRAGAVIGLSVSSVFAFLLFLPAIRSFLRVRVGMSFSSDALDWLAAPVAILATLVGGVLFAVLVDRARREPLSWRRSGGLGLMLMVACAIGLVGTGVFEPIGIAGAPLFVFRVAFTVASCLIAFACTAIAARVFGLSTSLKQALLVGAAASGTFLLVALAVDPIPGWHVGGGDRAMLKVATLGNFIAGWIGGALAFVTLVTAPRRQPAPGLVVVASTGA